jgi:hypothetical protein
MTKEQILHGNERLAKFMGYNIAMFNWKNFKSWVLCDEDGEFQIDMDMTYWSPNSDCQQLWSVLDKIEKIGETSDMFGTLIEVCTTHVRVGHYVVDRKLVKIPKLECAWKAAVTYVEWLEWNPKDIGKYIETIYIS